jgi:peroxiredoxin
LADYRDHFDVFGAAGVGVVAISVDVPEHSETLRRALELPFPILCDAERRVVRQWDIYNSRERGGIAKPAVFVVEPDRTLRFASVDSVVTRVPASEVVRLAQTTAVSQPVRRRSHIPRWRELRRAIRNNLSR